MIRIESVRYTYPGGSRAALDGVTVGVADSEFVLVTGSSGGGKSTLARAVCGLVPHFHGGDFEGSVRVAGFDTRSAPPRELAGVVGFVAQDPASGSVASNVEDEICFTMENLGLDPSLMRKRLEETLDVAGIAHLRGRDVDALSGGERQRVAIAAVLAAQPSILVLDEPTSQLDPGSAEEVLAVLHRLNLDLGLTIVLVEHRLDRVVQHVDRIVVLESGGIVADGAPREVLSSGVVSTPLTQVGRALGWDPLPLTVRAGRTFARRVKLTTPTPRAAAAGSPVVRAQGVRVARGGIEVLRGVDLSVSAGEIVAIAGRNGSGKTTLLRTLAGLLRRHAGRIEIAGFDPAHAPVERIASRVAYVPQNPDALLYRDTVAAEVGDRGHLERHGLAALEGAHPRDLSAGERLRVALAAITSREPDVMLLDEPTRGLDAAAKAALVELLEDMRAFGTGILLVTHDVELIASVATRVAMLAEGAIVVDGPVRDVLGESSLFSSQMNKVFGDPRILTVDDVLTSVRV